mgnify:CR=1 FL=1
MAQDNEEASRRRLNRITEYVKDADTDAPDRAGAGSVRKD